MIETLRGCVPALQQALPVTRVALFGSWAKGRATAFSDIDLLVVYDGPKRPDDYEAVLNSVRVRGLEPHVYCVADAAALHGTLELMTVGAVDLLVAAAEPDEIAELVKARVASDG